METITKSCKYHSKCESTQNALDTKPWKGLSKQQLGSRKKSENHRGHCGRRDLIFGLISHIGSYQYDNDVVWGFEASDCFDYAGQNAVIHKAQISNVLVVIDGRDMVRKLLATNLENMSWICPHLTSPILSFAELMTSKLLGQQSFHKHR